MIDTGAQKDLGPRGHRGKALFMDYLKNGGLRNGMVTHSFLVIPECPYPLLAEIYWQK